MEQDILSNVEPKAPETGESRFNSADAEAIMLSNHKSSVNIGGRDIEIKPLNMFATKQVWTFIRNVAQPMFTARRNYNKAMTAWAVAMKDDPNQSAVEMPFPNWWMEPVEKVFDDITALVTLVLQRTDAALTVQWVADNIEPMVFFQDFLPVVIRQNRLDTFIKKLTESEMAKGMLSSLTASNSPKPSDSTESQPTSVGTTPA